MGRFVSPDTIIPSPASPQSFNRYSYVYNRPVQLVDPTGHDGQGTISTKYKTAIEATSYFISTCQLATPVDNSSSAYYDNGPLPPILLGAAMDRQNAARRGDLDSIVELLRSDPWFDSGSWLAKGIAGIKPTAFGDRVSMGPANIEPREMKRWIEMGWLEPASDDAIRVNLLMPGQAITMMALKLHEADQRISLQGGNNVDPTTRFMLLAIAQNHKFDMGFITKFFSSDPAIRGWENLLSRSNRKQLKGMLENILWLQEQGWALPAGVDLRRYWQETLGDAVQAKDSDLYDELENMLK